MRAMLNYLKEIIVGARSLATGMWIVLRHTLRNPVTVNYPYESLRMTERFRGLSS